MSDLRSGKHCILNRVVYDDRSGSRDDVVDLLYYLLNESQFLHKDKLWTIIHRDFSKEVEEKVTTIAQDLRARGFAEGLEKGIEKGIETGKEKEKMIIAERLISEGHDLVLIAKVTELTLDELKALKKKLH